MTFLIILLLVVLFIGLIATAVSAIIDFVLNALGWIVIIGLVLGGVLMLKAGLGLFAIIPVGLGIALAVKS